MIFASVETATGMMWRMTGEPGNVGEGFLDAPVDFGIGQMAGDVGSDREVVDDIPSDEVLTSRMRISG